ncbi:MAG TPA: hypothetical protein VHH73_16260 [Verrucomicrobiae bacterium]|nr:hypothetical protein [Verrucomicrobiae bacterium]
MKRFKQFALPVLVAGLTSIKANAVPTRTDINPASFAYQSFLVAPDLAQADRDYLLTNEWRGQKLPDRAGELLGRYDAQFRLVRAAAQSVVPCDWGIDMSQGPYTLLPHLARAKAVIQITRLRAMWALQHDRPNDARDELIAAMALARNTAQDHTLIAALVQIAGENILLSVVAENYGRFSPETLQQIMAGFDAAPARTPVSACMATERDATVNWLVARIHELQKENPANEAAVLAGVHDAFVAAEDDPANNAKMWQKILAGSGGTGDGLIKLAREMEPLYTRAEAVLALPKSQYDEQMQALSAEIQNSTNPLVGAFFPAYEKCRVKDFMIQSKAAMVRAAVEYKLHGEAGLKSVNDPFGNGPFEFQRFFLNGVDRGFQLRGAYNGRGFPETLIFTEKDGPAFLVDGKDAGKPVRE